MSETQIQEISKNCGMKLRESPEGAHHPSNIMDTANFNMSQYRISWCIRGDNIPEYAEYLGYPGFLDLKSPLWEGQKPEGILPARSQWRTVSSTLDSQYKFAIFVKEVKEYLFRD